VWRIAASETLSSKKRINSCLTDIFMQFLCLRGILLSNRFVSTIRSKNALTYVAVGFGIVLAALLYAMNGGHTDPNWLIWTDRDFSNYWIASRLVLSGKVLDLFSGQDIYFAHMQAAFGADYPWHNWSYSPSFLLLVWPLGLLPHTTSMVVFLLLTMLVFLHAVSVTEKDIDTPAAVLLIPYIACNIITAQNGFISGALILYGLALRDRRPWLAGIAFGLLTIKPQLGLLIPILLLFERRWLVIMAAGMTTLATVGLSGLIFGVESWRGYVEQNLPYQSFVMTEFGGTFVHMMPSLYGALRSFDVMASSALAVHMVVACLAFAAFVFALFRLKGNHERSFALLLASFLVSPYTLTYDLGGVSAFAAIWAHKSAQDADLPLLRRLVFSAVAFLPLLHSSISTFLNVPIAPPVLATGLLLLLVSAPRPQTIQKV
jgi:Glycosyltransferase family 87